MALLKCDAGGTHEWQYQGGVRKLYTCTKCALEIAKIDLKEATDA